MTTKVPTGLSRRESQILDILHTLGRATAVEVQERLPDAPGYSSVRKLLEILEEKKMVRHTMDGRRFVYAAVTTRGVAGKSALRHLLNTFFDGSVEEAAVALFTLEGKEVDSAAIERIEKASRARKNRR